MTIVVDTDNFNPDHSDNLEFMSKIINIMKFDKNIASIILTHLCMNAYSDHRSHFRMEVEGMDVIRSSKTLIFFYYCPYTDLKTIELCYNGYDDVIFPD